jgi:nitrite reductase/ring-hydroxylating ferredoxin subunit
MAERARLMDEILICASDAIVDGGKGVRFALTAGGEDATGFVVRHGGTAYAYLNRCAHVPIELDWNEGEFFESSKLYLMCSTHGAIYIPESGHCAGGRAVAAGCGRSRWSSATSRCTGNRTITCAPRAPD